MVGKIIEATELGQLPGEVGHVCVYPLYSIVQLQEAPIKPNQIKAKEKALKSSPCSELTATLDETIICSGDQSLSRMNGALVLH